MSPQSVPPTRARRRRVLEALAPLLVSVAMAAPALARAEEEEVDRPKVEKPPVPLLRLASTHALVGRINPLGLIYLGQLGLRLRLFEDTSVIARDNFVGLGVVAGVSPAFARGGLLAEIQPLEVVHLSASYEVVGWFGTFDALQSFPGVTSEHSDSTLDDLSELDAPLRNYGTSGTLLTLSGTLRGKVGPIAVRDQLRLIRPDMDVRAGDRTFYDLEKEVLAPDEGWYFLNDLDVLWVTDFGLVAGARWTATHAFYERRHYADGEDPDSNPNTPHHRLGPILAYTFWDDAGQSAFDRPTVLLVVNWWLEHRYRTGADVTQALPYVLLGFTFTGDLLAGRR